MAKSADTSDHVANENWWPSISNVTSRSNDLLPWLTVTRLTVRAVTPHWSGVCPAYRNESLAASTAVDEDARR